MIEGTKFAKLGDAKLKELLQTYSQIAVARYTPHHTTPLHSTPHHSTTQHHLTQLVLFSSDAGQKLKIVRGLQKADKGSVIAVTGNAIGDCQSLSAADVGIALGGSPEAVQHAADILVGAGTSFEILLDAIEFGMFSLIGLDRVSNIPTLPPTVRKKSEGGGCVVQ